MKTLKWIDVVPSLIESIRNTKEDSTLHRSASWLLYRMAEAADGEAEEEKKKEEELPRVPIYPEPFQAPSFHDSLTLPLKRDSKAEDLPF